MPFARLLAGLASHPRRRIRFTAIFCGLLGGRSHQGKGLCILLPRHTLLHTITDCNTSQAYSKGPGRAERENRGRWTIDESSTTIRGWWFPHRAKFENRKILQ